MSRKVIVILIVFIVLSALIVLVTISINNQSTPVTMTMQDATSKPPSNAYMSSAYSDDDIIAAFQPVEDPRAIAEQQWASIPVPTPYIQPTPAPGEIDSNPLNQPVENLNAGTYDTAFDIVKAVSVITVYDKPSETTGTVLGSFQKDEEIKRLAVNTTLGYSMVFYGSLTGYINNEGIVVTDNVFTLQPTPAPHYVAIAHRSLASKWKENHDIIQLTGDEVPERSSERAIDNGLTPCAVVNGVTVYSDMSAEDTAVKAYIEDMASTTSVLLHQNINAVCITGKDLKEIFTSLTDLDVRVLGCTSIASGEIWLNGSLHSSLSLYHELLHGWDSLRTGTRFSGTQEFLSIYAAEKEFVSTSPGNHQNEVEFFASAGEIYLTNPSGLEKAAPLTYAFFDKYFK